jgi:hypothetical protein
MKKTHPFLHLSALALATSVLSSSLSAQTLFQDDFSSGVLTGYTITPSTATATNGVVIVDGATTPANPFAGNAIRVFDTSVSANTFVQRNYSSGADPLQLFQFDAAISAGAASSGNDSIRFRVSNQSVDLTSNTNAPFELELRMNGDIRAAGETASTFAAGTVAGSLISIYTNTATISSTGIDLAGNSLTLNAGHFAVYTGTTQQAILQFNSASTGFTQASGLGRFGFVSGSGATGGDYIFDNLAINAIPEPSSLILILGALATGAFMKRRQRP